jgi:serine/threonine-protein kinase RsbT
VGDERQRKNPSAGVTVARAGTQEPRAQETCIAIQSDPDIVDARQKGRELAAGLGFSPGDLTLIATVISELARNIVLYAKQGEIILHPITQGERRGIVVKARDDGPGIPDVARALQAGYSTSRSLGLGLTGVKRLMDEFEIVSKVGAGTTVMVKKWKY